MRAFRPPPGFPNSGARWRGLGLGTGGMCTRRARVPGSGRAGTNIPGAAGGSRGRPERALNCSSHFSKPPRGRAGAPRRLLLGLLLLPPALSLSCARLPLSLCLSPFPVPPPRLWFSLCLGSPPSATTSLLLILSLPPRTSHFSTSNFLKKEEGESKRARKENRPPALPCLLNPHIAYYYSLLRAAL